MAIRLTEAQTAALRAQTDAPAEIETSDGRRFVLLQRDTYSYLSSRSALDEAGTTERLREMIQKGIDSGDDIPADEVYRDLMEFGKQIRATEET